MSGLRAVQEDEMPIYEYQCTKCNEHTEVMRKISDEPLTRCKSCGGELKKLITSTSFILKGGGWYVTDYPSTERKKAMEDSKPKDSGKDSAADKKTESPAKPDAAKKTVNA